MNMPVWLLRLLPMWDYICPACRSEVKKKSHTCPLCGENYAKPLRVPPRILSDAKALENYVHEHIFPKVSPATRDYLAQFFTELFNNGFEEGNFSAWTAISGTVSVQSTTKHTGTYGMKAEFASNWANSYAQKSGLTGGVPTAFTRFYFQIDTLPADGTGVFLLELVDTAFATIAYVGLYRSGANYQLRLTRSRPATVSTNYNFSAATGTWYCVEIKFFENASTGEYRVYLDGTERITDTGLNTSGADFDKIRVGRGAQGYSPFSVYIDCVVVADAYIGPESGVTVQTVNDSFSLADAALRNKTLLPVSDSVGLADSLFGNKFLLLGDSASLSELVTVIIGEVTKYVTDSVNLADVANVLKTLTTSDTVTLVDAASTPSRVLQALEAVGMADNVVVNKVLQITEAISLAEVVQVGAGGVKKTKLFLILGDLAVQLTGD